MNKNWYRGLEENNEFVYGYYVHYDDVKDNGKDDCDYIVKPHDGTNFPFVKVKPDTVDQCTGLYDINKKDIYENDIVKINGEDDLYLVQRECDTPGGYWAETGYILKHIGWSDYTHFTDTIDDFENECQITVVGNIHQNPELVR